MTIKINGGATETIFPEVEVWLNNKEHLRSLGTFHGGKKAMESYVSVCDFVFCACFPTFKQKCFAYYSGTGPQFKDMASPSEIKVYQTMILDILNKHFDKYSGRSSWAKFVCKDCGGDGNIGAVQYRKCSKCNNYIYR